MKRIHSKTRSALALAAGLASALLITAPSAQATIIFTTGNNAVQGEVPVTFTNGNTGATITGTAGANSVLFTSLTSETLTVQGQHIQNNAGGNLTSTNVTVPGFFWGDFIFGLQGLNGTATVTVTDNKGNTSSFPLLSGQGQTFLTITTAANELISNVAISAPSGVQLSWAGRYLSAAGRVRSRAGQPVPTRVGPARLGWDAARAPAQG